jgi:hypothetical protein
MSTQAISVCPRCGARHTLAAETCDKCAQYLRGAREAPMKVASAQVGEPGGAEASQVMAGEPTRTGGRLCPRCGQAIPSWRSRCEHCTNAEGAAMDPVALSAFAQWITVKSCPQCGAIYHGGALSAARQRCQTCNVDLVPKRMVLRWEIERIVFLVVVAILAMASAATTTGPHGELFWTGAGFTALHGVGIVSMLIVCSYILGHHFLGIPQFKAYMDAKSAENSGNALGFCWQRFAFEFLYMVVPVGAVAVLFALMALWRWLISR